MNKLKVVWICHFSNPEVREILSLTEKRKYSDFAPWITNMIPYFEKRDDIELHIIAPHRGLKRLTYNFEKRGIHYHFFKPDVPIVHRNWPSFFPLHEWTKFVRNRLLVKLFLKRIKPDLINLHGAENPYYSITVLDIKDIPVFVCIQGIYSNPKRFNHIQKPEARRIKIERAIHGQCTYFGIFPPFFADLIKRDNHDPVLLRQNYIPNTRVSSLNGSEKKYDFVFFGSVSDIKGVDKIIEAVGLINNNGRSASLNIIGPGGKDYQNYLQSIIKRLKIENKVFFSGNLPTIQAVHKKAIEAKVTVISSKFENLPGTIIESVLLGQPVAATAVGGIPFLNKDGETILLSEYGDVQGLADNMLKLLDNPEYASQLTEKCRRFILKEFNAKTIVNRYIRQYRAIIDHYHYNTPIPEELLFNKGLFEANP